jgi:hypothetical protein
VSATVSAGGASLQGVTLADGNVIVVSSIAGLPQIAISIKQTGNSFSNATLNGTYKAVEYQRHSGAQQANTPSVNTLLPAPRGFKSTLHTFIFDGQGNFTNTTVENLDGVVSNFGPNTATYSVAADGTVSIAAAGYSGAVLAGGSVFVLSATSNNTDPGVLVGIRQ